MEQIAEMTFGEYLLNFVAVVCICSAIVLFVLSLGMDIRAWLVGSGDKETAKKSLLHYVGSSHTMLYFRIALVLDVIWIGAHMLL